MSRYSDPPLPKWHPNQILRDWGNGDAFRVLDALTGVSVMGATGSGKSSAIARHIAYGYLSNDFGGILLCSKPEEAGIWKNWAAETGRLDDLILFDSSAEFRFNFLDWCGTWTGKGGGVSTTIVSLLDEIADAVVNAGGENKGDGRDKFWTGSLHLLNFYLVELVLLAGLRISLPLLRSILTSAPRSVEEAKGEAWQSESTCARVLGEADKATAKADDDTRTAFEDCQNYFLHDYPNLSERTRSIIHMSFIILVQPFLSRPLCKLLSSDTNIKPEDTWDGKIIIIDLPVQEWRLAGRVANILWKYCFQISVLRRSQPADRKSFLRPVFLWADEAQNFITKFDAEFQAVARSAGACTVYLTQNRESYLNVLGNFSAVDCFLGNLQCKLFAQSSSSDTNVWASKLLGERWVYTNATNVGNGHRENGQFSGQANSSSGVTRSEQKRLYVEPSVFTTLKRGGELHNFQVQAICYKGGHLFPSGKEMLPYTLLTFNQR